MMNKQSITRIMLTIFLSMMGINVFAYDFKVENTDGVIIYYNYINNAKELEVANSSSYSGNIVIPEEVTYMNRSRKVTSIGDYAFRDCSGLTSVTIPNSVKSIGAYAFSKCSGLTSVTIPNSVTSIGDMAFYNCISLTSMSIPNSVVSIGKGVLAMCSYLNSVIIGNSVTSIGEKAFYYCKCLTTVTIGNSVTSIGEGAFADCTDLLSVTIPNSVISIGKSAFYYCSGLTSLTIGNSVTSIGMSAFSACSALTSVTIPNSVTSIGDYAFSGCSGLTSITIPNSVTSIGDHAFAFCSGLTSVTIPNSVTSIGNEAFYGVDIPTVISLIKNPFKIGVSTFTENTLINATLYVPVGTIDKYKATEGWKLFMFIEEWKGPNGGGGETPETKKCAKPQISYNNGRLIFNCDTEGAACQYTITDNDIKSGSANELQLGVTYHISVYATKSGYDDSDIATATLCWIDAEPRTEGLTNNVAQVRAKAVLIQSSGSMLTIAGADEGTAISVYDVSGKMVASATAASENTNISTSLRPGDIALVKIGDKTIKVFIK